LDFTSVPEHYVLDEKLILYDYQIITRENNTIPIVALFPERRPLYKLFPRLSK